MTESELITALSEWNGTVIDAITLYFSILIAYFIAAHLVGKALTIIQLVIINSIYLFVMLFGLLNMHGGMIISFKLVQSLQNIESNFVHHLSANEWLASIVTFIYLIAFLASLYYMSICRRGNH